MQALLRGYLCDSPARILLQKSQGETIRVACLQSQATFFNNLSKTTCEKHTFATAPIYVALSVSEIHYFSNEFH